MRVGRTPENDLVLLDAAVSRRHALFSWDEESPWIEDLGSRHGTYCDGARVRCRMKLGGTEQVRIGEVDLRLEPSEAACTSAATGQTRTLSLAEVRTWQRDLSPGRDWGQALDLLHAQSLALVTEAPPEGMASELLGRLMDLFQAREGVVLLRQEDGGTKVFSSGGDQIPAPEALTPQVLEAAFQRVEVSLSMDLEASTAHSMAVPLAHEGDVLGLMHFRAEDGRTFRHEEVRLAATFGNLVAARILHQRAQDEVARRRDLERELAMREAATRARGEFLATTSHELRAPLQALLGFTQLALEMGTDERVAGHLRKAEQAAHMLGNLVNDVLDFSKIESGHLRLEAVPFHLGEMLGTVEAMFKPQADARGIGLEAVLEPGLSLIRHGDPLRLGQVLINLVGNAIKFTTHGRVTVCISGDGAWVGFDVSDTGIGLDLEAQSQIFEPYVQASAGIARQHGGTGLGLAISRHLVSLMGGEISLSSAPGRGSTFSFRLPLPEAAAPPTMRDAPLRGRVLCVEDDAVSREILDRLLTHLGLTVSSVDTGHRALEWLGRNPCDGVITDLQLPDMSGFDLAADIRERWPALPVVALSGDGGADVVEACRRSGMHTHLSKPAGADVLASVLGEILPPSEGGRLTTPQAMGEPLLEGHAPGVAAEICALFLREHRDAPETLSKLLSEADHPSARRLAHAMKGACLAIGANGCAQVWEKLETAVGQADDATMAALCEDSRRGHVQLCARLLEIGERKR